MTPDDASPALDLGQTIRGLTPGQRVFRRYVLVRILGHGGMGVVWLAKDDSLETVVALKFLPESVAHDPGAINDLKRETRRSLQLTHPNILRIFDFVEDERSAAIAMEYVEGSTLTRLRLDRPSQTLETNDIGKWVKQICEALDYAHRKARVVHRDLKPANLMVDAQGDLKIADFGISASITDTVSRTSRTEASSGTPVYMSPQQMMGEKQAVTDDVYSLGATLYELLTGKPPFYSGRIEMQVMQKLPPHIAERRAELGVVGAAIPPAWEETIAACLAKEPADRPQSARQVAERLELVSASPNSQAVSADRTTLPQAISSGVSLNEALKLQLSRKSHTIWLIVLFASLILLAGVVWWLSLYIPEQNRAEDIARLDAERKRAVILFQESKRKEDDIARLAEKDRRDAEAKELAAEAERLRLLNEASQAAEKAALEQKEHERLLAAAERSKMKAIEDTKKAREQQIIDEDSAYQKTVKLIESIDVGATEMDIKKAELAVQDYEAKAPVRYQGSIREYWKQRYLTLKESARQDALINQIIDSIITNKAPRAITNPKPRLNSEDDVRLKLRSKLWSHYGSKDSLAIIDAQDLTMYNLPFVLYASPTILNKDNCVILPKNKQLKIAVTNVGKMYRSDAKNKAFFDELKKDINTAINQRGVTAYGVASPVWDENLKYKIQIHRDLSMARIKRELAESGLSKGVDLILDEGGISYLGVSPVVFTNPSLYQVLETDRNTWPAVKIGFVDLALLLDNHWKTKLANIDLRAVGLRAQQRLDQLNNEGKALVEEYKMLMETVNNFRASQALRGDADSKAKMVMEQIQKKTTEVREFERNTQNALQIRIKEFREETYAEIASIIASEATLNGYTIILDKSGPSIEGRHFVGPIHKDYDLTLDIQLKQNAGH